MRTAFEKALDDAVASFLRDESPWPVERPDAPRIGGIGTVAAHALQSPLLTRRLRDQGVAAWTTVTRTGVDELADDPSWDLAMVLSPHKLDAGRRCDALTPSAEETGVVDTLRRTGRGVLGCNTNAVASATALAALVGHAPPRRVLVAGTGASTRSVLSGLRRRFPEAETGVWGRSAEKVATTVGRLPGAAAVARPSAWGADVVVNATTVGEAAGELPADFALLGALAPGVRFFDLNNRPGPLQQAAVSAGCVTISGVMMQLVTNALRVALLAGTAAPITGPFTPPLTTANG
jgi:shikimate dehydrogenase